MNREMVLLAGGGRALLLQVAHPLVAAGVEQHSNYREDPWGRLLRTLDLTTRIVFGDEARSATATARLDRVNVGLLPPSVRDAYDLPWGPRRERVLAASTGVIRRTLPLLPALVREFPPARSASRRTRAARRVHA